MISHVFPFSRIRMPFHVFSALRVFTCFMFPCEFSYSARLFPFCSAQSLALSLSLSRSPWLSLSGCPWGRHLGRSRPFLRAPTFYTSGRHVDLHFAAPFPRQVLRQSAELNAFGGGCAAASRMTCYKSTSKVKN